MEIASFLKLKAYCEKEQYKGWDPYDGLNSKLFQFTPLKNNRFARLAWIQAFKRNPINLRSILKVPKQYNSKGIGLFLYGYCNLYQVTQQGNEKFGKKKDLLEKINYLADLLINLRSKNYTNTCWGYNFDWQNRVFYQPKFTPTVVATSFCGEALFKAYEITKNTNYLDHALSSCNFVIEDLNRTKFDNEQFIFSYSPLDTSQVYNASLLGAKLLAIGYSYNNNNLWKELSKNATRTIINKQAKDGSWIYGEDKVQTWIDSFHTGFNLECIWKVSKNINSNEFLDSFSLGLDFYLNNFFKNQQVPKYYHNKIFPIDTHSPAQLIVTLSHTGLLSKHKDLAENVLNWTIKNMQSDDGSFQYQLKRGVSSKIPYMRWAQAWMFKAFTEYFKK